MTAPEESETVPRIWPSLFDCAKPGRPTQQRMASSKWALHPRKNLTGHASRLSFFNPWARTTATSDLLSFS
jgi:hypothetical protein